MRISGVISKMEIVRPSAALFALRYHARTGHPGIPFESRNLVICASTLEEALKALGWIVNLTNKPADPSIVVDIAPDIAIKDHITTDDVGLMAQIASCVVPGGKIFFIGGDKFSVEYERWTFDEKRICIQRGILSPLENLNANVIPFP